MENNFFSPKHVRVQSRDNSTKKVINIVFAKCLHYRQLIGSSTLFQLMFSINPLIHYQQVTQLKFYYRSQIN